MKARLSRSSLAVCSLVFLSYCSSPPASVATTATLSAAPEPAGASCASGGYRIDLTIDSKTTSAYVCNSSSGTAAVAVGAEAAGSNCPSGGQKLTTQVGDATAVTYVCNGASAVSPIIVAEGVGTSCPAGGLRVTGSDGVAQFVCNGENGIDGSGGSTVTAAPLSPGVPCAYGGIEVQVGSATPVVVCNGATGQLLTVNAGAAQSVAEDTVAVTLTGSAALGASVTWQQLSGPPVTLVGASTLSASFVPPDVTRDELLSFRLTATSGGVVESSDTTVLVTLVNRAPSLSVPANLSVSAGAYVTLTGLASDPDGQPLTYEWIQTGGTAVTLSGSALPTATFVAPIGPSGRSLDFSLSVSDGSATAASSVTVTVNAQNVGPVIAAIADFTATAGRAFSFQVVATDANPSETLSYSITPGSTPLPPWTYLNPTTGLLSGTPMTNLRSLEGLRVRVTDSAGVATDSNAFSIATLPGAPARLTFENRPVAYAKPNEAWPPFTVRIEDSYGNLTSDDAFVRLANFRGAAVLSGTTSVRAQAGRATFTGLSASLGSLLFDVEAPKLSTLRTRNAAVSIAWPTFSVSSSTSVGVGGLSPSGVVVANLGLDGRRDIVVANLSSNSPSTLSESATLGTFVTGTVRGSNGGHRSVAVGDLNADGLPDLAGTRTSGARLSILFQVDGELFIDQPAGVAAPTGGDPYAMAIADMNGDGRMDMISANRLTNNVSIYPQSTVTAGTFPTRSDFATGTEPRGLAVADLNQDGFIDVVTANNTSTNVSVLLQDAAVPGSLLGQTTYAAGTGATSVAVGDFNNDALPDLAVANNTANTVSILLQNSAAPGTFLARQDFSVAASPLSVAVGDLDGDGRLDFATASASEVSVRLQRTSGAFGFVSQSLATGAASRGVAIADLNGDSRLDIVATIPSTNSALVFLQTPRMLGSFVSTGTHAAGGSGLALADFNGDAWPDVASANFAGNTITVSLQNPGVPGTFSSNTTPSVGSGPYSVAAADINGDGLMDVAAVNVGSTTASILLQDPNIVGTFAPQQSYPTGGGPSAVRLADVNADGRPDLIVAAFDDDVVTVYQQDPASLGTFLGGVDFAVGSRPIALAVGDLNGDGALDIVTSNDVGASLSLLFQNPAVPGTFFAAVTRAVEENPRQIALGDINRDGRLDIVVANRRLSQVQGSFSVLLQSAATPGTFPAVTNYPTGPGPSAVALADLNDDGRLDVAVGDLAFAQVVVRLQSTDGTSTFNAPVGYASTGTLTLEAMDMNLDGRIDLVSSQTGSVRVLLGE